MKAGRLPRGRGTTLFTHATHLHEQAAKVGTLQERAPVSALYDPKQSKAARRVALPTLLIYGEQWGMGKSTPPDALPPSRAVLQRPPAARKAAQSRPAARLCATMRDAEEEIRKQTKAQGEIGRRLQRSLRRSERRAPNRRVEGRGGGSQKGVVIDAPTRP